VEALKRGGIVWRHCAPSRRHPRAWPEDRAQGRTHPHPRRAGGQSDPRIKPEDDGAWDGQRQ